ncbi:MAG: peroxidase family protein [Polyangiales bacterium]
MSNSTLGRVQIVASVALLLLTIPACDQSSIEAAADGVNGARANAEPLGEQGRRSDLSVVRGINQPPDRGRRNREPQRRGPEFRNIDGSDNNERDAELGAANTQLARWCPTDYADGASAMAGAGRPSARDVSNAVVAQIESVPNRNGASDLLWQWGQFLDHDIDLTDAADPPETEPIAVPTGDPFFDPTSTGAEVIPFNRSLYDKATGDVDPRQQMNEITHWVDASNVYGSEDERAAMLRTNDGTGKLLVSEGNLLPFNHEGLPNAGGDSVDLFLAGDVRANEQVGLTALHTLFVREHNRLADEIAQRNPNLSGDEIYERARQIVAAQMQVITYEEFLPTLLGAGALTPYNGYTPNTDARISNLFSGAVFRLGHSMLSGTLLRLDANGNEIAEGHLPLRNAFFAPSRIIDEGGIEPLLRGLALQTCQQIDVQVVDDVRNFLFGPPGAGGFDLPALNMQRGRDHGLPDYNTARVAMGLEPKSSFAEVTSDSIVQERLASVYGRVDEIDVWLGGLAEDPVNGGLVGELVFTVVKLQFERLRDGDRFWYERLPDELLRDIADTRLADIIRRNTTIGDEIPSDVFRAQ